MVQREKTLGARIAQRRRSAMLTQAELAERIDVTTETISRIERGRTSPSLSSLRQIAAALGCDLPELLTEEKKNATPDRGALDRLVASVAHREPDDIHLVADIAIRIFQRFSVAPRRGPNARRR